MSLYIFFFLHLKPDPASLLLKLHHRCWRDSRDKAALTGKRNSLCDCEREKLWDTSHLWCKCRLVGLCCTVGTESYSSFWCLEGTIGTKTQTNQPKNPTTLGEGVTKMHGCCGSVVLSTAFFCDSTNWKFQLLDLIPLTSMFGHIAHTHFSLPETSPNNVKIPVFLGDPSTGSSLPWFGCPHHLAMDHQVLPSPASTSLCSWCFLHLLWDAETMNCRQD